MKTLPVIKNLFVTLLACLLASAMAMTPALAAAGSNSNCTNLGVSIDTTSKVCGNGNGQLEQYISLIVTWADSAITIIAIAMIIYGGIKYIYSMGNPDQIKDAKGTIVSALAGVFLLAIANILLIAINPNLAGPVGKIFHK